MVPAFNSFQWPLLSRNPLESSLHQPQITGIHGVFAPPAATPIPSVFIHGTFKGEPSITIPKDVVALLPARFEHTLIGHEEHSCTIKYPELQHTSTHKHDSYIHKEFRPKQKAEHVHTAQCSNKDNFLDMEKWVLDIETSHHNAELEKSGKGKKTVVESLVQLSVDDVGTRENQLIELQNSVQQVEKDSQETESAELVEVSKQHSLQHNVECNDVLAVGILGEAGHGSKMFEANGVPKIGVAASPCHGAIVTPINVELGHAQVGKAAVAIAEQGNLVDKIEYSEGCPISNSFEVLSMSSTKQCAPLNSLGVDSRKSIQDELKFMSLDPKSQLGDYISDKEFIEKFIPAQKITRTRKKKQIFDL